MAYGDTSVPVSRSQEQIRSMLIKHGARGFQIHEEWATGSVGFSFVHAKKLPAEGDKPAETVHVIVRMVIPLWLDRARYLKASQSLRDQRMRQVWRALFWYLKNQLEAVEFGLRSFEDAFLTDIVTQEGRTIGETMKEALADGKVRLALPPGGAS